MRLQRLTALETGQDQAGARRPDRADQGAARDPRRRAAAVRPDQGGAARDQARSTATSAAREIIHAEGEFDLEDLIAEEQMVVSITRSGYIKRLPLSTYRKQKRGGVGVIGMETKEDDYIEHLRICSTHDFLLFFTNYGQGLPAEGLRAARGRPHGQGPGAREPAAAARGRARARGDRRRATSARTSTSCSAPSRA